MDDFEQESTFSTENVSVNTEESVSSEVSAENNKRSRKIVKFILGFMPGLFIVLIAVALILVGLNMTKSESVKMPGSVDAASALSTAEARYDLNNSGASSAPQQTVVNGWYTNDLLVVLTSAVSESSKNYRPLAENQQKIIDSNQTTINMIWLSVSLLLLAFGGYFMLSNLVKKGMEIL